MDPIVTCELAVRGWMTPLWPHNLMLTGLQSKTKTEEQPPDSYSIGSEVNHATRRGKVFGLWAPEFVCSIVPQAARA
jgi:hypothetical protein